MPERARLVPIENLDTARFRCVFPECGGICCKNGRPGMTEDDVRRIEQCVERVLPRLRTEARRFLRRRPWLSGRRKQGLPTLAVTGGWCVFFNEGCTLQRLGMDEGEPYRYKPEVCVRFPLEPMPDDPSSYYVRQWGYRGEAWDLFCLNPAEDPTAAAESLRGEIDFLAARART